MSDVAPKKSLGQHWLYDTDVLHDIADSAQLQPGETILEIGPGLGTLTEVLLSYDVNVTAVEFDQQLFDQLTRETNELYSVDRKHLTLVNEDILRFDLTKLPSGYKVVANIPYYLTSHLIRLLSESTNPPSAAVLLIQKEVAERVCASPGNMSILSVTAQYFWNVDLGNVVPARLFTPPPKVDSQILILERLKKPLFDVDEKAFFRLVKIGFSNKRKTLHNSLAAGLRISKDESKAYLESAGIAQNTRAQELSLAQWHSLYMQIQDKGL